MKVLTEAVKQTIASDGSMTKAKNAAQDDAISGTNKGSKAAAAKKWSSKDKALSPQISTRLIAPPQLVEGEKILFTANVEVYRSTSSTDMWDAGMGLLNVKIKSYEGTSQRSITLHQPNAGHCHFSSAIPRGGSWGSTIEMVTTPSGKPAIILVGVNVQSFQKNFTRAYGLVFKTSTDRRDFFDLYLKSTADDNCVSFDSRYRDASAESDDEGDSDKDKSVALLDGHTSDLVSKDSEETDEAQNNDDKENEETYFGTQQFSNESLFFADHEK